MTLDEEFKIIKQFEKNNLTLFSMLFLHKDWTTYLRSIKNKILKIHQ